MIEPKVYRSLGLTDEEYGKILNILKRPPRSTELAMFSVEWSEHCGYPRSRRLLKLFPRTGKYETIIGEDSGGIIVDDLAIVFKMESHNHPSQVEPKQGAATGVGGIIRDIFTSGARPIALLDSLRFGPPQEPYSRYLLKGVVEGIQFYGNCLGVPTVGGEIYFDQSYRGNCLVNVMAIGIGRKDSLVKAQAKGAGNSIIYAGASTGRDGIGGCSVLASQEFGEEEEKRPAVQIGDPFLEKCLIEATLEVLEKADIVGIKDMGAAGLTCCTTEMAACGRAGVEVELNLVPRKEEGMLPWEVMMSESQERMLICAKKGEEKRIIDIFSKWGLNASVIGRVTSDGMVRIKDNGKIIAEVEAEALTQAPLYDMAAKMPEYLGTLKKLDLEKIPQPKNINEILLSLLSSPSIGSKEWVYEQYDHMVQTNTVVLPGSDAALIRLKGTDKLIAATCDGNSRYCYLDPYLGGQIAVAEAARNLVCCGAEPAGVTDCLNFGNPEKPDRFWQFRNCVEGIAYACRFLNIPVVSGNVSFYNESPQGAIFPTPIIGMVGIIDDAGRVCQQSFKKEGDAIILLGNCKEELGGSEYLKQIHNITQGQAPCLDLSLERSVEAAALEAIKQGLVRSAHDCSEGGLAVALAESCISDEENMVGAVIDNLNFPGRIDALLFGESPSRIIISCGREFVDKIRDIAERNKTPMQVIGRTGGKELIVKHKGKNLISLPAKELSQTWHESLARIIAD